MSLAWCIARRGHGHGPCRNGRQAKNYRVGRIQGLARRASVGKHLTGIYLFGQDPGKRTRTHYRPGAGVRQSDISAAPMASADCSIGPVLRAALPVCLPYFAQEVRNGQDVRHGYLRAVSYLTAIGWPFSSFLRRWRFRQFAFFTVRNGSRRCRWRKYCASWPLSRSHASSRRKC
jgi:hypothetical protein